MAFPIDPLNVVVELSINGTWTDITSDVYLRNGIDITRGRADEGARVDTSKCTLTLNNRHGRYSPRNPLSPYYGRLGRNTPVRVHVIPGPVFLSLRGTQGRATTPDTAALDVTGDLDVRLDAALDSWTEVELAGKYNSATNQRSWLLRTDGMGRLMFRWSTDGVTFQERTATAPVPPPVTGRLAVRATLDVDNGAGGHTVTFYRADTLASSWTQIGSPVITAGTTSIFNSTAPIEVGDIASQGQNPASGQVFAFELRNGIAGPAVANPDFTAQTPGTAYFADAAGRTWGVVGGATVTNRRTRFAGEISAWPSRWDVSGKDVYVSVEASGILRRLGQGASPLDSTLRRRIPTASPLAYWPFEEEKDAVQVFSPIKGVAPLRVSGLSFASDDSLPGSKALPALGAAASFSGSVPASGAVGQWQVEFVFKIDTGPVAYIPFLQVILAAPSMAIFVWVSATTIDVQAIDATGAKVAQITAPAAGFFGTWTRFQVWGQQNGANVNLHAGWLTIGGGGYGYDATYAGTAGHAITIDSPFGAALEGMRLGHLAAFDQAGTDIYNDCDTGFTGESTDSRIYRLCAEENIPASFIGAAGAGQPMGPQRPAALLDLLGAAADADGGILFEPRDTLALRYRDRISLYNQTATLALDYRIPGEVAPPLEPVDDDRAVRNDITVTRTGGSSGRAVLDAGPLSVQLPPAGVGRYDDAVTLNLQTDDQTSPIAAWHLHFGTWDESRFPTVHVNLAAGPHLIPDVLGLDIGDLITIAHPPPWLPPDTITLIAQGYTESIGLYDWDLVFNCTPAGPWSVGVTNDNVLGRVDTDGSQLASGLTTAAATLSVAVTDGPLWTTNPAETPWDIRIGGEVMTVTAVTGTASPQAFAVIRSVNGVTKSHLAGADVRLAQPAIVAL